MSALHRAWINDQADKLTGRPEWARSMKTTLAAIREHGPCADGWAKLLRHLGKTSADAEPLMLLTILGCWVWKDWKAQFFLETISPGDKPIILMTRVGLMGLFVFLLLMVRIVWHRRAETTEQEAVQ